MKKAEVREKLSEGWLQAIVTFEVAGKPKEHVEDSLTKFMDNIKKDERLAVMHEIREPAEEHDDGVFSAFSEVELLAKNLETLTWLCVNFSPASIEIEEPEDFRIPAREITNWFNDLLAKMHDVAHNYRSQKGTSDHLVVAMNQLIGNAILLSLKTGDKTEEQISRETGIGGVQLEPFLESLVEKGKAVQLDGKYRAA